MTVELLPCPFCGGSAATSYIRDGRACQCRGCGASVVMYHGPGSDTEDRVRHAWNTRAPLSARPGGSPSVPQEAIKSPPEEVLRKALEEIEADRSIEFGYAQMARSEFSSGYDAACSRHSTIAREALSNTKGGAA